MAFSRTLPAERTPGVEYVQGGAADKASLASVIAGADVVVAALDRGGHWPDPSAT